ncbi:hypothetical protein BV96_01218 [Sphingomonas paucimobilis]|nr:hypothetical protein BV96_01218 [Sphingomonas paucimobilis]
MSPPPFAAMAAGRPLTLLSAMLEPSVAESPA